MNEYMVYAIREMDKECEPSTLSTPSLNASVGVTFFNVPNEERMEQIVTQYAAYTPQFSDIKTTSN